MKKIFTLLFASVLISAGAFAQKRYHNENNSTPSYQYQSNGYPTNGSRWKDDNVGYTDHSNRFEKRDWDDNRFMSDKENVIGRSRFYNDNYDRYRFQKDRRFSLQIVLGDRHRF